MRKLLAGCLALCIPALLTAQTPADSISRTEAIDSVVVHRPQAVDGLQADGQYRRGHRAA